MYNIRDIDTNEFEAITNRLKDAVLANDMSIHSTIEDYVDLFYGNNKMHEALTDIISKVIKTKSAVDDLNTLAQLKQETLSSFFYLFFMGMFYQNLLLSESGRSKLPFVTNMED